MKYFGDGLSELHKEFRFGTDFGVLGKKDVAGILLIPLTHHVMLHLNDCCKWKEYIRSGRKRYRKNDRDIF